MRKKYQKKIRHSKPIAIQDFCPDFIKKYAKNPHQDILRELWNNWDMVCPEEIASLVIPHGYKEKTLLLGAENPVDLQEIRMYYSELLERVNVFLTAYELENHFEKIEFSLVQGKKSLLEQSTIPEHLKTVYPPRPKKYGEKVNFHGNRSLERCYETFCNCLDLEKKMQNQD